jgi:hypothetical protein
MPDHPTDFFHEISAATLGRPGVATGTMMGFPCLRVSGAFFASCDHRSGDLIVKLPRHRVEQLIARTLRRLIEDIRGVASDVEIAGADLKRVPAPFPADHPGADLLRHKAMFQLRWSEPLPSEVSSPDLVHLCAARLALLADLHRWLLTEVRA